MVKIKFINSNKEIDVPSGYEFLDMLHRHPDLPLKYGCKRGECGTCAIKILHGMENLTKLSPQESETLKKKGKDSSYRLACQCAVNGNIVIE